jgi:hypothetical protein
VAGVCGGLGVRSFFDYVLIALLPFWQQLFELISRIAWPIALVVVFVKIRPIIVQLFTERGFSFEGFGAHLRVEERKIEQASETVKSKPLELGGNLQLPRTVAIDEEEKKLLKALSEIPEIERMGILLNALAIERLEKNFALIYQTIFGSQLLLLQKINERGGLVSTAEAEAFFTEVKSKFSEYSDWNFEKYSNFLVKNGLLVVNDNVTLTPAGKDFILFVVRYGLNTEKGL